VQDKASKCSNHPGTAAVAECAECGAALCLNCSVPVRGKVLGAECLPEELRGELPAPQATRRDRVRFAWTGVGATIAVVASVLPWKRYGLGSGLFGAWGATMRWSILAGAASIACLLLWALVSIAGMKPGRTWRGALRILAILIGVGAALHLLRRPGFGPQAIGPWVCLAGAAIAFTGTFFGPGVPGPLLAKVPVVDSGRHGEQNRLVQGED
jgi:hypothetical protein